MKSKEGLDIEEALKAAGGWGRYQKLILLLSFAAAIPNAFIALHFVFSQYEPPHHCSYPPEYHNFINETVGILIKAKFQFITNDTFLYIEYGEYGSHRCHDTGGEKQR